MPKCDLKVAKKLYRSHTSEKYLAAYFQGTFSYEQLWRGASVSWRALLNLLGYSTGIHTYIVMKVMKSNVMKLQVRTLTFTSKNIALKLENGETNLVHSYNRYRHQKSDEKALNWLSNNNVKEKFPKYNFLL